MPRRSWPREVELQPTDTNQAPKSPERKENMLAKGDRYMAIAFILPISIFIGYAIGWWLDSKFGTKYWSLTGLLVGIAAGFLDMIRQIRSR